jgi:hypothetical protein
MLHETEPMLEKPPDGHRMQVACVMAPEAVEKLPALHPTHVLELLALSIGE